MNTKLSKHISTTFVRTISTTYLKELVKEAKRVEYEVETWRDSDTGKGPIYGYQVKDNGELVFKALAIRKNIWAGTFSKLYWQEPTV